jgi:hypothetical protein
MGRFDDIYFFNLFLLEDKHLRTTCTKYRPFPFCSIKIEAIHLGGWVDECFNVVDPWPQAERQ